MTGLAIAGVLGSTALDSRLAAAAAVGALVASGNEAGVLASGVSVAMDTACVPVLAEATTAGAGSDGIAAAAVACSGCTAAVAGTTIAAADAAAAADLTVAAALVAAAEAGCCVRTLASGVLVAMKTACSGQGSKEDAMPACEGTRTDLCTG